MINQDMNQVFKEKDDAKLPIPSKDQYMNGLLLSQMQIVKEARDKPKLIANKKLGQKKTKISAATKTDEAVVAKNKTAAPAEDFQKEIVSSHSPTKKTANAAMTDTERRRQAFKLRS